MQPYEKKETGVVMVLFYFIENIELIKVWQGTKTVQLAEIFAHPTG